MNDIKRDGYTYITLPNTKVFFFEIEKNEKQFRVYACLGLKNNNQSELSTVGMLFVRFAQEADKADWEQLLHEYECDAEELCSKSEIDDGYFSQEIESQYGEHIINYDQYYLFTFPTDQEGFKQLIERLEQCKEADNITETLESTNSDESTKESLREVETIDQSSNVDATEQTVSDKPISHKKKIVLAAVSSIILLTIPVGYAIIKGSNQQEDNVSSSDTDSAIESITSTTQNADNQISSTIIETSESETIVVTTSSPPNLDLDGNGTIDDDDYRKLVKYNLNPNQERTENIKQIYDVLDYDKDGDIDPDEWDKYISKSD